jgi:ubiquinone/menaquinone biosynthesis C-methylase UbiE
MKEGGLVLVKKNSSFLFNAIAPIYGLFYFKQKKWFAAVLNNVSNQLDLTAYKNILDVGCGTGALCSVLNENGLSVTGIDPAEIMLFIAKKNPANKGIHFVRANALERLPFSDKCFDVSIASYVAHGMRQNERKLLYAEMSRETRSKVLFMTTTKTDRL